MKLKILLMSDWIDDFLADKESTLYQITIIESLLNTSSSAYMYEDLDIESLTYDEAEEIIKDLKENNNPIDPRDQFNKMF